MGNFGPPIHLILSTYILNDPFVAPLLFCIWYLVAYQSTLANCTMLHFDKVLSVDNLDVNFFVLFVTYFLYKLVQIWNLETHVSCLFVL